MVLGAGGIYFLYGPPGQRTAPTENVVPQNPPPGSKTDSGTTVSQPVQPESNSSTNSGTEGTKPPLQETQQPDERTSSPETKATSRPRVADTERAKQAIALGNIYFDRGAYDDAIAEFRKGLEADPGNARLKELIMKARSAKRAEEALESR